jgi:hypothetical protein
MKKGWISAALTAVVSVAATGALAQEAAPPQPAPLHTQGNRRTVTAHATHADHTGSMNRKAPVSR